LNFEVFILMETLSPARLRDTYMGVRKMATPWLACAWVQGIEDEVKITRMARTW